MKLNKPQIQLVRRRMVDADDEFSLHAVTFFKQSNLRASGTYPIPTTLEDDGSLAVDLKVIEDPDIPYFEYLTPVVHTIELGVLPFANGDGLIKIRTIVERLSRDGDDPGEAKVMSSDADEDSRPIGHD